MRALALLLLVASIAWGETLAVEIRDNQIWLIRDGRAAQLTHDGKTKPQAILSSPDDPRIAYYEQCAQGENCVPSFVILDLAGKRLQSFHVDCASILDIAWVGSNRRIAVECHENPSLSEYLEIDVSSGKTVRAFMGYGFSRSPDSKHVAHVGPVIHFAPPFAQSNYLMIDDLTVYPLPQGVSPAALKELDQPAHVVRHEDGRHLGIHRFVPDFAWSPDGRRVAFVDCVFDWLETGGLDPGGNPYGKAANEKCSVAVVSLTGAFTLIPLGDVPAESISGAHLSWAANGELETNFPVTKRLRVP